MTALADGAQEAALPRGRVAVSCVARLGAGGLGRHLQEILDALERSGSRGVCVRGSRDSEGSAGVLYDIVVFRFGSKKFA